MRRHHLMNANGGICAIEGCNEERISDDHSYCRKHINEKRLASYHKKMRDPDARAARAKYLREWRKNNKEKNGKE